MLKPHCIRSNAKPGDYTLENFSVLLLLILDFSKRNKSDSHNTLEDVIYCCITYSLPHLCVLFHFIQWDLICMSVCILTHKRPYYPVASVYLFWRNGKIKRNAVTLRLCLLSFSFINSRTADLKHKSFSSSLFLTFIYLMV